MKTVQVSKTEGPALDWLVAKCEGAEHIRFDGEFWRVHFGGSEEYLGNLDYSTDWSIAGPIIDQMKPLLEGPEDEEATWWCSTTTTQEDMSHPVGSYGPTALVTAMRCYVMSKLGVTVEIPEELA